MEILVFLMIVLLDILLILGVFILSSYSILLFVDVILEISELFCDFFERRKEKKSASLKGIRVSEKEFLGETGINTVRENQVVSDCTNTFEERIKKMRHPNYICPNCQFTGVVCDEEEIKC